MCKLQTDVIIVIFVFNSSKRGGEVIHDYMGFGSKVFKLVPVAILDLALQRKMQGFLGGTWGLFLLKVRRSRISHNNMLIAIIDHGIEVLDPAIMTITLCEINI